jgi:predicted nucleotidyltransferase
MYAFSVQLYAISMHMNILTRLLSSQVRAEIFRLLFNRQETSIHLRDLQRKSGLSIGTIQKEMTHLKEMDLVVPQRDGNRLYYAANTSHPLYSEICGLVEKTSGAVEKLKEVLSKTEGIECAFIFGSFAKGDEKAHSDIDLIIIGDIGLRVLSSKFKFITEQTEREINPHIYSLKSWKERIKKKDHFVRSIKGEKKIFLIGDEDVLS